MGTGQVTFGLVRFGAGAGTAPSSCELDVKEAAQSIRRLDAGDLAAIERHLLGLSQLDRAARFLGNCSDARFCAYARGLDPSTAILLGGFNPGGRLIGLAEAHPTDTPGTAEIAMSIDPAYRRQALGRRLFVRLLDLTFASGVQSVESRFDPRNQAVVRFGVSMGARLDPSSGHVAISRDGYFTASLA
jgi:hypothetical protein